MSDHPSTASSPTQVDNEHYYFNSDASELEKSIDDKSIDDRVYAASPADESIYSSGPPSVFDPNLPDDFEVPEQEDSPYAEVRAAVANVDDPSMPVSTLRVWVIGMLGAMILPGLNQFFYLRYPTVNVGGLVAQLLVFPLGRFWARFCPNVKIFGVSLNPGPFSMKEHVLVTVMASVGAAPAYVTDIVAVQRLYYHSQFHFIYQWMLAVSTQLIGFSFGGIARRFLVAPPSMIWPNTLVQCALFNTLHSQVYAGFDNEGISRERYFMYAFLAAIMWYFVPGYLFEALSVFSWACWIAPKNVRINQIFGYRSGLGFSLLTFDWNQIAFIGSPLATPWWAEANIILGFVFFFWFLTPILYYTNAWYSHYLPMSSNIAFDNTGQHYNVSRILNKDGTLDLQAYKSYSPLFLAPTFVMSYGLSFLAITATITHSIIYFWTPIKLHFRRSLREQPDVHARLMSRYRQVPEWYYLIVFGVTFAFACICIELWPTGMPIWAFILALVIAFIYVIPIGMIQALTNRQVGLNVITELIVGYMLPGRPIAMMLFKTYGYVTMSQAMQFTADFKLGHYMKVPPRPMFFAQVVASVVAATTQLGVLTWMFANIPDICTDKQKNHFTCEGTQVFGTASVIWGVIGPALQFSKGQLYYGLLFFFIIGAILPAIPWLITRRYPRSIVRYINFPLLCTALQAIPPATAANYVPWAIIGFIFQYLIRRRYFMYWAKYNYTLSAALDAGTAIGTLLVYFMLQYPNNGSIGENTIQRWWGNRVHRETMDWRKAPLKKPAPGETFGPATW